MRSVHKAKGSLKDHITYCSIRHVIDKLPAYRKYKFSSIAMNIRSLIKRAINNLIEPLRYFEPYTISA
jgi:hypothetical protein